MSPDRLESRDPSTSVNRRITLVILIFASLSLLASGLPLWPGVRDYLPLEFLGRKEALTTYSCFLLGFMAFLLPVMLKPPSSGPTCRPWFWVGGFMLAFAGVPLYVLAYIAGVQLKGVLVVLAWAGVIHGTVLLLRRSLGAAASRWIVGLAFVFAVVLPVSSYFGRMTGDPAPSWSPFSTVVGVTRDFRPPELIVPGVLLALVYGFLILRPQRTRSAATALMIVVGAGSLLTAAAWPSAPASIGMVTQGYWVPGRPLPIRLEVPAGKRARVEIGERESFVFEPGPGDSESTWIYPVLTSEHERITATLDGETLEGITPRRTLPVGHHLVAFLGEESRTSLEPKVLEAAQAQGVTLVKEKLPDSLLGWECFGAVIAHESTWNGLGAAARKALDDSVAAGGHLVLLGAQQPEVVNLGLGRVTRLVTADGSFSLDCVTRAANALEANLNSTFALPDWGRVNLTGLILFLLAYHVVFYLIFLLPFMLDSHKSMGVYLVSVGFVLTLEIVGGWWSIREIFLRDNQILEQDLSVWVLADGQGSEPRLLSTQIACFASFNAQPAELTFDRKLSPRFVPADESRGVGDVRLAEGLSQLTLASLPLDRFQRKQIVRLDRVEDSPIGVEAFDGGLRLEPRPGVSDPQGLQTARRVAAFARIDGWLYAVTIEGNRFTVSKNREERGFRSVLPQRLVAGNVEPFVRHALGRLAPALRSLLVIILEGADPLHDGAHYLSQRSVVQMMIIPIN